MSKWRKLLILIGIAIVVWVVIAPNLATFLIVEKPLTKADAIFVLSGSKVYRERIAKAAELYKRGVSPIIYISNDGQRAGWSRAERTNPTFLELEQRELIAAGVSPDAIHTLPGVVNGTDDEAKAMALEISGKPINSLVIVTSAYHTRRSLWTFDKILKNKNVEIGIVGVPPGGETPAPGLWWLSIRGWPMVAGEYLKMAVYWVFI